MKTETYIKPHLNGVRLTSHDKIDHPFVFAKKYSDVFSENLFNIYIIDNKSQMIDANEHSARTMGFDSPKTTIGKSVFDIAKRSSAQQVHHNDLKVFKSKKTEIIEEELFRSDGECLQTLSIKSPLYDEQDNVIGILGCSIVIGLHSLAASLSSITSLGLLKSPPTYINKNQIYLSRRENECLILVVQGKTAREIAILLDLSKRTVEHYIENIKIKYNVGKKSELIEKVIKSF